MIPVKEAIQSGSWFNFFSNDDTEIFGVEPVKIRMRVLSLEKIDLSEVDEPHEIDKDYTGGIWWIMKIELINVNKQYLQSSDMYHTYQIILVDKDGYEFEIHLENHLCYESDFAKKNSLSTFYLSRLIPKLKYSGALTFYLPDDNEAEYSLDMANGTVTEA
jgi:hypothetical protein